MAERCYIHGPTTTAGTCPTCDAMQREDNEITRLRARLAEAEAAKAAVWDEAIKSAATLIGKGDDGYDWSKYGGEKAIRALVNPYRSKTDEPQ